MRNAKEYLSQIRRYDEMIDSLVDEANKEYSKLTRITPVLKADVVSGGRHGERENGIAKYVDLKDEINRTIDQYVNLKREASSLLAKVSDINHYKVLHRKYILYETFEQIAIDMGYSYRNICYIHGRALQAFAKILQEDEKHAQDVQ